MKRILSIDQSYNACAWCLFEDTILTDFGVITSDKSLDIPQRAYHITESLKEIMDEVDLVVLEGLSFGSISTSARPLAHLFYSIQCAAWLKGIDYTEVSPKAVKKDMTGSGNATKTEMFKALPLNIQVKFKNSSWHTISRGLYDLVDSWAVGQLAMKNLKYI